MKLKTIKENLSTLRENTEELLKQPPALPTEAFETNDSKVLHKLLHAVESDIKSDMIVILRHLELLIDRIQPKGPGPGFEWTRGSLN
jgi:hypothetical protein